jgi:putative ABC transport system permease protein
MSNLLSDFRYALRGLRAHASFSIAAVLTLALGIGVTTAMFGVLNGIVLRPLPFRNADRLITICTQFPGSSPDWCSISPPNVADIAARSRTIEVIGLGRNSFYHMKTESGTVGINGGIATPGMFRALGVRAERGRLLEDTDLLGRESDVALLTHELWQTQFAGDPNIVGRSILLDGHAVVIIGVLDSAVSLPKLSYIKLWRPLDFRPSDEKNRAWAGLVAFGRLKPGVSMDEARADLAGIAAQLRREHFAKTPGWDLSMESVQDLVVGRVRPILLVFLAAVFLVLLIACANVANLLLARSAVRGREIALRSALGAGRWRIVRALLVESFALALAGAILGVGIAEWGTAAFQKFAPPTIPRIKNVEVDLRVLAFALLLGVATTVVFGLVPAIRASRVDLAQAIREGGRSASHGRSRLGALLVVTELALALMLVSGAGLLARSFAAMSRWNPGFEREHLLTFSLFANAEKHRDSRAIAALWNAVEAELRTIPGVTSAGSTSAGPLFGGGDGSAELQRADKSMPTGATAAWFNVSPGYFNTLGVPFLRGRDLDRQDSTGGPRAVLVNETLVRRYWPAEDPVGKRFSFKIGRTLTDAEIIGVVRDVPPITPGQPVAPQMYWSDRREPRGFSYFVLRTAVPPAGIMPTVRARLAAVDPDLDPGNVNTMPELISAELTSPRFDMLLLVTFAIAALALSAVGTYGLFAYVVSRRTRELGIRLALGAAPKQIVSAVLRDGLGLAGVGIAIGAVGSVLATRVLRGLVPGVSAMDPITIALGACLLLVVAAAACFAPARRAGAVDPVVTLTAE